MLFVDLFLSVLAIRVGQEVSKEWSSPVVVAWTGTIKMDRFKLDCIIDVYHDEVVMVVLR
jgi:hypothetical protein